MFLAKPGKYMACKLFSTGHLVIFTITSIIITVSLYLTRKKSKEEVLNIIKKFTVILWALEILKIIFNIVVGNSENLNTYVPLYFCSIILYAGIISSFSKREN